MLGKTRFFLQKSSTHLSVCFFHCSFSHGYVLFLLFPVCANKCWMGRWGWGRVRFKENYISQLFHNYSGLRANWSGGILFSPTETFLHWYDLSWEFLVQCRLCVSVTTRNEKANAFVRSHGKRKPATALLRIILTKSNNLAGVPKSIEL